jgi:hypothetical protein
MTEPHGEGESSAPPEETRRLHPMPRGLVELYGLLAVLFVLVPEWMAGGALLSFREVRRGSDLPVTAQAWRRVPELRLASLTLAGLRHLAREERIRGYSGMARDRLTQQLLKKLSRPRQPLNTLW